MSEERLKNRWHKHDEDTINAAVGALLQHEGGRKMLWWLLRIGKVGMQPYSGNALNTAFTCGELNVGQQILDRITSVSPDGYVTMMKEMADERGKRDGELVAARAAGRDNRDEPGDDGDDGNGDGE